MARDTSNRSLAVVTIAVLFTASVLGLGYALLGWVATFLFAFGFLGGLIVWLLAPTDTSLSHIKTPYFLTLFLFALHKLEERHFDFFPALSQLTGVPAPESGTALGALLYAFAGAWLLIPWLVGRHHPFGYFLAATFFVAMGVTELAHFVFPFFAVGHFGYFPGMASVVFLAPAAWWGFWRMYFSSRQEGL